MATATQMDNETETRTLPVEAFYPCISAVGTPKADQEELTSRTIFHFRKKRKYFATSKHSDHKSRMRKR